MIHSSACRQWRADQPGNAGQHGDQCRQLHHVGGHDRPHARCIEPTHWRVIIENDFKYGDLPPPDWVDPRNPVNTQFTARELEEIEECITMLRDNEISEEDLGVYPAHIRDEIIRRLGAS
mgnify:CR=1 FL=1|jgi:hypothetical protein